MKKKRLLAVLFILLLLLCGCSSDPKNFYQEELTITLTKEFEESSMTGFNIYLESDDVLFSAVKEYASDLEYSGYEINSLNDYSLEILELNSVSKDSLIKRNNYYYFVNSGTTAGASYTYVHCMFEGSGSYWVCEFVCKTKNYSYLKDKIFQWADSIVIEK